MNDFIPRLDRLQDAVFAFVKRHNPDASRQHKAAFLNAVFYLVFGFSLEGQSGPSTREHLVSWKLAGPQGTVDSTNIGGEAMTLIRPDGSLPKAGEWTVDAACQFAAPLCFGPAEDYRELITRIREREHCFDDDPEDLI